MSDTKKIILNINSNKGDETMKTTGNTKNICVDLTPKKTKDEIEEEKHQREQEKKSRIPKKRVVTNDKKWEFEEEELQSSQQLKYIMQMLDEKFHDTKQNRFIQSSFRQKLSSYRNQDMAKDRYSEEEFVKIDDVIELLQESSNICYYCREPVQVLYEYVREPKQWTLERIDNTKGHNKGNLMIACLGCNLGRRTMHQERYVFTKQLNLVKKNNEQIDI
jgi:hypothetical protein